MKTFKRFLVGILTIALLGLSEKPSSASGIITSNQNKDNEFVGYRNFKFLDIRAGLINERWRLHGQTIEGFSEASGWVSYGLVNSPEKPDAIYALWNAPGLGRSKFMVKPLLNAEVFQTMQILDDKIVEVGLEWITTSPADVHPKISIYERKLEEDKQRLVSSFQVEDRTYKWTITSAIPVSSELIVLVAQTNIQGNKYLVFYDLAKKSPVGILPFSLCQYLPFQHAFWISAAIPNYLSLSEFNNVFEENKKNAQIIPIWEHGVLNPKLKPSDGVFTHLNSR